MKEKKRDDTRQDKTREQTVGYLQRDALLLLSFTRVCFEFLAALTFRAVHGKSHCVNQHHFKPSWKKMNIKKTQKIVTHVSVHTMTFHDTHYSPPPKNPWSKNCLIYSREDDKSQTNNYSGRRKDNSKTLIASILKQFMTFLKTCSLTSPLFPGFPLSKLALHASKSFIIVTHVWHCIAYIIMKIS